MLKELSVSAFIDVLASDAPAPGGGSVSALSGALAAGLVQMVCRLSLKPADLEARRPALEALIPRVNQLQQELTTLVDTDTEAFNEVMAAFKLPKGSDDEKAARSAAIQKGYVTAINVPLRTAECCVEVAACAVELAHGFNRNAESDLGVAVECARTGMLGGLMNVRINLSSLKDQAQVRAFEDRVQSLESAMQIHVARITALNTAAE